LVLLVPAIFEAQLVAFFPIKFIFSSFNIISHFFIYQFFPFISSSLEPIFISAAIGKLLLSFFDVVLIILLKYIHLCIDIIFLSPLR
jgi:hypothetical protein